MICRQLRCGLVDKPARLSRSWPSRHGFFDGLGAAGEHELALGRAQAQRISRRFMRFARWHALGLGGQQTQDGFNEAAAGLGMFMETLGLQPQAPT